MKKNDMSEIKNFRMRAEKERDMSNRDREIAAIRSERKRKLLQFAWKMNERSEREKEIAAIRIENEREDRSEKGECGDSRRT